MGWYSQYKIAVTESNFTKLSDSNEIRMCKKAIFDIIIKNSSINNITPEQIQKISIMIKEAGIAGDAIGAIKNWYRENEKWIKGKSAEIVLSALLASGVLSGTGTASGGELQETTKNPVAVKQVDEKAKIYERYSKPFKEVDDKLADAGKAWNHYATTETVKCINEYYKVLKATGNKQKAIKAADNMFETIMRGISSKYGIGIGIGKFKVKEVSETPVIKNIKNKHTNNIPTGTYEQPTSAYNHPAGLTRAERIQRERKHNRPFYERKEWRGTGTPGDAAAGKPTPSSTSPSQFTIR